MPSRPVLIGRGLVPTPYKTNHHGHGNHHKPALQSNARVHMQFPNHKPTRWGRWSTREPQLNTRKTNTRKTMSLEHTPDPGLGVGVPPELRRPWRKGNTRSHTEPGS